MTTRFVRRRGWDSNPRTFRSPVFKLGARRAWNVRPYTSACVEAPRAIHTAMSVSMSGRPGGAVVVYQAAKHARRWAEWFPRDWRPIALPKSFTQMLPVSPTWATDYALLWWVGEPPKYEDWMPRPNRDWYVSRVPNFGLGRRSIPHPCPRPVEQMRYLVSLVTPPGGTVLDPFLGSGTTALAAKDTGRRAIGIEIEEKWCALSVARCSQEVLGLSA
jgi:hypothetical protein